MATKQKAAKVATGKTKPADMSGLDTTVVEYANKIKPLLAEARQAFGSQPAGSTSRVASDKVNDYILQYTETGNKMPALSQALDGEISLSGLRRRVRVAKASQMAGNNDTQLGRVKRPRGKTDEAVVAQAAKDIQKAREVGGKTYGDAVRKAYAEGIALQPIADELGISYFALWSARRSAY